MLLIENGPEKNHGTSRSGFELLAYKVLTLNAEFFMPNYHRKAQL